MNFKHKYIESHIYALIDPNTNEVRYVGATVQSLKVRLLAHSSERNYGTKAKLEWIKSLRNRGQKPIIKLLETVPIEQSDEREKYYILYFLINENSRLTNDLSRQ